MSAPAGRQLFDPPSRAVATAALSAAAVAAAVTAAAALPVRFGSEKRTVTDAVGTHRAAGGGGGGGGGGDGGGGGTPNATIQTAQ